VAKRVVIVLLESWVSGVMVMWVSGFIIHYVMPIYRLFIINRINQQSIIFIISGIRALPNIPNIPIREQPAKKKKNKNTQNPFHFIL